MKKIFFIVCLIYNFFMTTLFALSTIEFIDSVNRKIEVPKKIERIVPSGYNTQIILAGFSPEMMVSISKEVPKKVLQKIPTYPNNLPITGQFYGKTSNFNKEELINLQPDIIIDIGEKKKNIVNDLNEISKSTDIPVVFIEFNLKNITTIYDLLGKLLNKEEKAKEINNFLTKNLNMISDGLAKIPLEDRLSFIQVGGKSFSIDPANSSHTEAIETAGGINKAKIGNSNKKSRTENLNIEEIITWDPDIIFVKDKASYEAILEDSRWSNLKALKNKKIFLIPENPYNYVTSPPSINKIMGVFWAAQIMYPQIFDYDLNNLEKEFNHLIFGF